VWTSNWLFDVYGGCAGRSELVFSDVRVALLVWCVLLVSKTYTYTHRLHFSTRAPFFWLSIQDKMLATTSLTTLRHNTFTVAAVPHCQEPAIADTGPTYVVGDLVEAYDGTDWYRATVLSVDGVNAMAEVHYDNWVRLCCALRVALHNLHLLVHPSSCVSVVTEHFPLECVITFE
jgi:hypothetical protein